MLFKAGGKRNLVTDFFKGIAIGVFLVFLYIAPWAIHKAHANPVLVAGTIVGTAATVYATPYMIHEANKYYFHKNDCPPGINPETQKILQDMANTKAVDVFHR